MRHVFLASGACLPLRPIAELRSYLDARADTDFIESATTADVPWTVGGLDRERFTLRFPFAWKKHRKLFDGFVKLQQVVGDQTQNPRGDRAAHGFAVVVPDAADPDAILRDPNAATYDRYFRRSGSLTKAIIRHWRAFMRDKIESRSLTLAKFDFQGKPHIFYDDHAELLQRSRSIRGAQDLARCRPFVSTLSLYPKIRCALRKNPIQEQIDRVFAQAVDRRTLGRQRALHAKPLSQH